MKTMLQRTQEQDRIDRLRESGYNYTDQSGPGAKPNNLSWGEWMGHLGAYPQQELNLIGGKRASGRWTYENL